MRHFIFIIVLNFLSFFSFGQSEYSKGFNIGYKEGYCYNDYGCIAPTPPISPTPYVGENSESFQDGYNRGFKLGIEDKQKDNIKKETENNYSNTSTSTYSNIGMTYQGNINSSQMEAVGNALNQRIALYQQNEKYINRIINWLNEIKSKTNDNDLNNALDSYYNLLISYSKEDLALYGTKIKNVELGISSEIEKYNNRLKEKNDPNRYWKIANEFLKQENYKSAIFNYNYVVELAPNFAEGYFYRGYAYQSMHNNLAAIEDYSKFIDLKPDDPLGYHSRGWIKYFLKDYMGALSDFNKQIELNPTSKDGYYNRGSVKSELNDQNGAINDYLKAIEIDPNFSMAYNNIAWAKFNLKKYSEALIDANKAIELDDKNFVAYDSRAEIRFNLNDYKGCIIDSDIALQLNPKMSNSYFLKGRASYRLGEKQKACEFWSNAGELGKKEAYDYISKYCNN